MTYAFTTSLHDVLKSDPFAGQEPAIELPAAIEEDPWQRFRKPLCKKQQLVSEFTHDKAMVLQYQGLLQREQFTDSVTECEENGIYTLILREGNMCVGGAQLAVSTPRQPRLLPLEMGVFRLDHAFPELKIREMRYGQLVNFYITPEYNSTVLKAQMLKQIFRKIMTLGLDRMYAVTPEHVRTMPVLFLAMNIGHVNLDKKQQVIVSTDAEQKLCLLSCAVDKVHLPDDVRVSAHEVELS